MSLLFKKDKYLTSLTVEKGIDYSVCSFNDRKRDANDKQKNFAEAKSIIKQGIETENEIYSETELEEKLNNEIIATTYTLSENALFLEQKFNNDKEKIVEFYQIALDSLLEVARIPKSQLINAVIHFDQTTPHLHFAISNIYPKYFEILDKEILTVDYRKINLEIFPYGYYEDEEK